LRNQFGNWFAFILSFLKVSAIGFTELVTAEFKEFIAAAAVPCQSHFAQIIFGLASNFANLVRL